MTAQLLYCLSAVLSLSLVLSSCLHAAAGPTVNDQGFAIAESASNGASVGTVVATDPDGDLMTYSIVSGNGLGIFAINADTGAITIADNTNLDYESIVGHQVVLVVSVIDRNQIEDFDSMGAAGTVIPTANGFSNWSTTFSTPSTLAVGPGVWGGDQKMYNVGITGNPNRALGVYSSNGGTVRTFTCQVTVPASGRLALTWDTFLAWNRFTSASNRWGGVKLSLTGGDSSTKQATLTQASDLVTTWMNHDTATDKVQRSKTWTGVTPGVQTLTFICHVTGLGTPSGYSGSNNKNVLVAIDNLEIGEASKVADTANVTITINDVNDLPVLGTNTGFTVDPSGTVQLTNSTLAATDQEQTDSTLTYTVTTAPSKGNLQLSGSNTSSFTQADIDANLVSFVHNGSPGSSDSAIVTVSDGVGGNLTGQSIAITVGNLPTAEANGPYNVIWNTTFNLDASGSGDIDGDTLSYAWDLDGDTAYDDAVGLNPSVPWSTMQSIGRTSPGVYTIGLQVTSDKGGVATDTASLTIVAATPTLDAISNATVLEDSGLQTTNLTGITMGTGGSSASITAVSSDTNVLLHPIVTYTSPASTGSLTWAPLPGASGSATITVTITNDLSDSLQRQFTVTVTAVNDAPSLDALANLNLNRNASLQTISLTGISSGSANEAQTLSISALSSNPSLIPHPSISYTSAASTGSLSFLPTTGLSGTASIIVTVSDDGGTANGGIDRSYRVFTVTVQDVDDPPTLLHNNGITVAVASSIAVTTADLAVTDDGGSAQITYTLQTAPTKGTLRLDGIALNASDTFSQAQLDAGRLSYLHAGSLPESDSFTVAVADGGGHNLTPFTVAVTAVISSSSNAAPVVILPSGGSTWNEGGAPIILDPAASVSDADGNLANGSLQISIIAGNTSDDQLDILHQGNNSGEIGVSGSILTYGGNTLGSFSGGTGSNPLLIAFNNTAVPAAAQALLRRIRYHKTGTTVSSSSRSIQVDCQDGAGGSSAAVRMTVTLATVNDAPIVTLPKTNIVYTEGDGDKIIDDTALISDLDSTDFANGIMTITISSGVDSDDRLTVQHQGNTAGTVGVSGATISYGGNAVATMTGGSGATPLTISCTALVSPAVAQAILRRVSFSNSDDAPSLTTRVVSITQSDGDGAVSSAATLTIVPVASNDAPSISMVGRTFTEGDGSIVIDPSAMVSDVDSADFDSGVLTIDFTASASTNDALDIAHVGTGAGQLGVSGTAISYGGTVFATANDDTRADANGPILLLLNSQANATAIQALLRQLTFSNASNAPQAGTRSISLSLSDGDGGQVQHTITLPVVSVPSPPNLTTTTSTPSYTENAAATAVFTGAAVTDVDTTVFTDGTLTISISSNAESADQLEVISTGLGSGQIGRIGTSIYFSGNAIGSWSGGSNNTPLLINLNNLADATATAALLDAIGYRSSSEHPSTLPRLVQAQLADGAGGNSNIISNSMTVISVNDRPQAVDASFGTITGQNQQITINEQLPASDLDGDTLTWSLASPPSKGSLTLTNAGTGAFTYTPQDNVSGQDSFTFQVSDGSLTSTTATITINLTTELDRKPSIASEPSLTVRNPDTWTYTAQVDGSGFGQSADIRFSLAGSPPSGLTLTAQSTTSSTLSWPTSGVAPGHYQFGLLFVDRNTGISGYQPILINVLPASTN